MAALSPSIDSDRQATFSEIPLRSRLTQPDVAADSPTGAARKCAGCVERKCSPGGLTAKRVDALLPD